MANVDSPQRSVAHWPARDKSRSDSAMVLGCSSSGQTLHQRRDRSARVSAERNSHGLFSSSSSPPPMACFLVDLRRIAISEWLRPGTVSFTATTRKAMTILACEDAGSKGEAAQVCLPAALAGRRLRLPFPQTCRMGRAILPARALQFAASAGLTRLIGPGARADAASMHRRRCGRWWQILGCVGPTETLPAWRAIIRAAARILPFGLSHPGGPRRSAPGVRHRPAHQ